MGTLDPVVWACGQTWPLFVTEMIEHLHDFVRVMKLERADLSSGGEHGA